MRKLQYLMDGAGSGNKEQANRINQKTRGSLLFIHEEVDRLVAAAAALGVKRVVLFGSLARGQVRMTSDVDLLIVWNTPLGFLERTVELYRRLQPRVAADFLVYTPAEMEGMIDTPLVRRALAEGKVLYEA
jgi:predicted nucleotidyltransferase